MLAIGSGNSTVARIGVAALKITHGIAGVPGVGGFASLEGIRTPKLTFFPWYVAEAAIDGWWMSLTLAEQGLHFRLLSFAWANGGLNKNLDRVAISVGLSRDEFDKHWPAVAEKWVLNGLLVINPRQERERIKVNEKSEQAKNAVAIRQAKRRSSDDVSDDVSDDHLRASDSDSKSKSSEVKVLKENKDESVLTQQTDESWQLLLMASDAIPLVRSELSADHHDLWRYEWGKLDYSQRKTAIERLTRARYPDAAYAPSLEKYVRKEWRMTVRPASNGNTHKPASFQDEEARRNRLAMQRSREQRAREGIV